MYMLRYLLWAIGYQENNYSLVCAFDLVIVFPTTDVRRVFEKLSALEFEILQSDVLNLFPTTGMKQKLCDSLRKTGTNYDQKSVGQVFEIGYS